jgi:hypothetical protein
MAKFPYCQLVDQKTNKLTFKLMLENFHSQGVNGGAIRDILAFTFKECSKLHSQGMIKGFQIRKIELDDVYQKIIADNSVTA